MKVNNIVIFNPKVFKEPYYPFYEDYKNQTFRIVNFHKGNHVELKCISDENIIVKGYVHQDEIFTIEQIITYALGKDFRKEFDFYNAVGKLFYSGIIPFPIEKTKTGYRYVCGYEYYHTLYKSISIYPIIVGPKKPKWFKYKFYYDQDGWNG